MLITEIKKYSTHPLILGFVVMCMASSCAVFQPSERDFTANTSRMSEKERRMYHTHKPAKREVVKRDSQGASESRIRTTTGSNPTKYTQEKTGPSNTQKEQIKVSDKVAPGKPDRVTQEDIVFKKRKTKKRTKRYLSKEEIEERDEIAKIARKLKGAKYKYGGKNPFGFDCSGFVTYVFEKDEVYLPATARSQSGIGKKVALDDVVEGDLVFFGEDNKVSHVAIVTSNDGQHIYIIHSTTGAGVIEEDLRQSDYWMDRFLFAKDILSE